METKAERLNMLNGGMEELNPKEFVDTLNSLGYEIDSNNTFNYINSANERTYKAKSVMIREQDSKLHFCNVEARRDNNFDTLQALRFNSFVYFNNTIWEL